MTKFSSFIVILLLSVSFTAHAEGYPRGDVDRDGAVNISDVTYLIDNLLKGVPEGDVDQDGLVNISDVTGLIDYLLKGSWPDDPVTPPDLHEYVDLGLPSGTLWATCNVGADNPENYGDCFAWGETEPKNTITKYCPSSNYGYNGFIDNKADLDPEDDAAYVNWGPSWRMPTLEQQEELINNCTWMAGQMNGVKGYIGTGPNGNTLFLPVEPDEGNYGRYWSRTLYADKPKPWTAGSLLVNRHYYYINDISWGTTGRCGGCAVRAVRSSRPEPERDWVSLGLPSGTLWATRNIGANAPEEFGDYFAWGEIVPKDYYGEYNYAWYGYDESGVCGRWIKYCCDPYSGYNGFVDYKTELDPEDDAAYMNWGPSWRMPTWEQINELLEECVVYWTTKNGVDGELYIGRSGRTIFLPAAGFREHESFAYEGGPILNGLYWSRTKFEYSSFPSFYEVSTGVVDGPDLEWQGFVVRAVRLP